LFTVVGTLLVVFVFPEFVFPELLLLLLLLLAVWLLPVPEVLAELVPLLAELFELLEFFELPELFELLVFPELLELLELLPELFELPELLLVSIFAALPVAFRAVPLYSLLCVAVPALPSAVRLLFFWKAITAASVATPKLPSTFPLR
jgi:hypothetical protein